MENPVKGKPFRLGNIGEEWKQVLSRYQELQKLLDICDETHPEVMDQVREGASKVAIELGQIEKEISLSNNEININEESSSLDKNCSASDLEVMDQNWFIRKLREQYLEKREKAVSPRGEDLFIKMKNNCRPIPHKSTQALSKERTHYKISLPSDSRNPNIYYFVKKSKSTEEMKTKSESTLQQIFSNVDRIKEIVGNYTKKNVTKSMSEILVNPARCYFPEYYDKLNMARSSHKYKIDRVKYSDQNVKCTRCKKVITDQPILIEKKNLDAATSSLNFKKDQNCQACEDCRQCVDFMRGADSDVLLINRHCNEKCGNDQIPFHQKCTIDSGIMNDLNALSPTKIYCTPCDSISIKAFSVPTESKETSNISKVCSKTKVCSDKTDKNAKCSEKQNKRDRFYRREAQKCCLKEPKNEIKADELLKILRSKNKIIEDTNVYAIDLNNITSTRLYAIPYGLMNEEDQKDCDCRLKAVLPEPEEIRKLCDTKSKCIDSCKINKQRPQPCSVESACPDPCRINTESTCPDPCRINTAIPKKVKYSIKDECEENVLTGKKECVDLYLEVQKLLGKEDKSRRLCSVFDRKEPKCVQFKSKDTIFERASERNLKRGYLEEEVIEKQDELCGTETPSQDKITERISNEAVSLKRNETVDSIIRTITNDIGHDNISVRSPSLDNLSLRSPTKKPFVTKIYHSKGIQVEDEKHFDTKSVQYDYEDIGVDRMSPSRFVQTEESPFSRSFSKGIQYEAEVQKEEKCCGDSSSSCESLESCLKEFREEKQEENKFINKTNKQAMLRSKSISKQEAQKIEYQKRKNSSPFRTSIIPKRRKFKKKRENRKKILRDTLNYIALTPGRTMYRRNLRQPVVVFTEFKNFPAKEETTWCAKPGNFSGFSLPLNYSAPCPRCHCSYQPARFNRKSSNEQFIMSIKDGERCHDSRNNSPKRSFTVSPVDSFCEKMSDDSLEKGRIFVDSIFKPQQEGHPCRDNFEKSEFLVDSILKREPKDLCGTSEKSAHFADSMFKPEECSCPNAKIQQCECGKITKEPENECPCPTAKHQRCECGKTQKQAQECQTVISAYSDICSCSKNQLTLDLDRANMVMPKAHKCVQECQTTISVISDTDFCPCKLHNMCNELKFDLGLKSRHSLNLEEIKKQENEEAKEISQHSLHEHPIKENPDEPKEKHVANQISQYSIRENLKLGAPKIAAVDSQKTIEKCAVNFCPCSSKKEEVLQKICDSLQKEFCCQAVQTDIYDFRENSRRSDIFSQTEYFNEKITRSTSYSSLTSDSHFSIGDLYKYKLYHVMETQTEVKKTVSEPIFKVEKSYYDITLNTKLTSKSSHFTETEKNEDKKISWTLSDHRFLKEIEIVEEEKSNFPKWTLPDQRTFTPLDVRSCIKKPEKNLSDSEKNLIDEIKNVFGCESPSCIDKSINSTNEFPKDYSVYYNFPDYKKKDKINVILRLRDEEESSTSTYINLDSTSSDKTEIVDLSSCKSKDLDRLKEEPLPHSKYLQKDILVSVEKIQDLDKSDVQDVVYKRFGLEEEFKKIVLPTYLAKKNRIVQNKKTRKMIQRSTCDEMTQTLNQKGFHVKIRSRSTTISRSRRSSLNTEEVRGEQKDFEIEAIGKERSDYQIEDLTTDKSNLKTISWKTDDFENLNRIDKDSMKAIMDLLFNLLSPSNDKDTKTSNPEKESTKIPPQTKKLIKNNEKIVKNKRFTMKRQKHVPSEKTRVSSSSEYFKNTKQISNNKLLKSIMKKGVKTEEQKFPSRLSVAVQYEKEPKKPFLNKSYDLSTNYRKEEKIKGKLKARSFPVDLSLPKNKTVLFKEVETPKLQKKLVSANLESTIQEKPENRIVEPKLKYNTIEGQYEGSSKKPILLNRPMVKRKSLSLQSQKGKNIKKRSSSFPMGKSLKIINIEKRDIESNKANNHIIDYIKPEDLLDERTPWLTGLINQNIKNPSSKVLWRREARSSVLLDKSENIFDRITKKTRNVGNNIEEIIYHTNVVPKKSQIEVQICLKEKENKEKLVCEYNKKWLTTPSMEYVMNKLKRYPFLRVNKFKKFPDSRGDRKSKNESKRNQEIKKKSKRRNDLDKCMETISDLSSIPCTKEELTKRKLEEYLTTLKKLSYKLDDHLNATNTVLMENDFQDNLINPENIKVRLNMLERVQKDLWKLKTQIGQTHFLDFHSNLVLNNQNLSQKLVQLIRMEMDKIINFVKKIDRTCYEVEVIYDILDFLIFHKVEKRSLTKKGDCFAWLENQSLIESERKKLSQTKNLLNHKLDEINKLITFQMRNKITENATTESEILLKNKLERIGKVLQTELEYIGSLLQKKNS